MKDLEHHRNYRTSIIHHPFIQRPTPIITNQRTFITRRTSFLLLIFVIQSSPFYRREKGKPTSSGFPHSDFGLRHHLQSKQSTGWRLLPPKPQKQLLMIYLGSLNYSVCCNSPSYYCFFQTKRMPFPFPNNHHNIHDSILLHLSIDDHEDYLCMLLPDRDMRVQTIRMITILLWNSPIRTNH